MNSSFSIAHTGAAARRFFAGFGPTPSLGLFGLFRSLTLAQAHTGAAAVFGDEFDAGSFLKRSDAMC